MFFTKGMLKNFTVKYICWSLFLIKLQTSGLNVCNIIKKRLQKQCFLVKFAKFFRTPFFAEQIQWLLLKKELNEHYQRRIQDLIKDLR